MRRKQNKAGPKAGKRSEVDMCAETDVLNCVVLLEIPKDCYNAHTSKQSSSAIDPFSTGPGPSLSCSFLLSLFFIRHFFEASHYPEICGLTVIVASFCAGMWRHMLCTPTRSKPSPAGVRVSPPLLWYTIWGHPTVGMDASRGIRHPHSHYLTDVQWSQFLRIINFTLMCFIQYLSVWQCVWMFFWIPPPAILVPKERNVMIWTLWMGTAAPVSARKSPSSTVLVSHTDNSIVKFKARVGHLF